MDLNCWRLWTRTIGLKIFRLLWFPQRMDPPMWIGLMNLERPITSADHLMRRWCRGVPRIRLCSTPSRSIWSVLWRIRSMTGWRATGSWSAFSAISLNLEMARVDFMWCISIQSREFYWNVWRKRRTSMDFRGWIVWWLRLRRRFMISERSELMIKF